ncbi:hypothetical protein Pve01_72500 [Planomonospora venezuelensis]|nr:hypothetical protein Pve01_72500 [Planomonospora venezuelensis]
MTENSTAEGKMKPEAIFAIRDARHLDYREKVFLFVVASRGTLYSAAKVAADDMGLSLSVFRRTARALEDRGLLFVDKRPVRNGFVHEYRVNLRGLQRLARKDDPGQSDNGPSRSDRGRPVNMTGDTGQSDRQKETRKKTKGRSSSMTKKKTLARKPKDQR